MFQKAIIKKYLTSQNKDLLIIKWDLFRDFFHNKGNQERIRKLKEEQFQEGFLKELFVKIFDYIITPNENYNLITEFKNVKDSKKVDGVLFFNDSVKCVIELKGTNTTDLGKVEVQAFSYKFNQINCNYVITSNFEKLRFYIEDAIEFIEFNLFELTQDEFNTMFLCLSSYSIENDIPLKLKSESISQEDLITKQLYQDYSIFKRELFQNLILLNEGYDKLLLFKKSQKLLDRFLFLFFAEDRFLLPPNSVRLILDDWEQLIERDVEVPLYNRFKKYFGYLNTGFKGKRYDVFPYNGGLFKSDEVLDNINIDDTLLFKHTKRLSEYDFESEVDVNILGHIFENSLNEIEEISNELKNGEVDKTNSKRKKDGVFYTPKYITKYIVNNTIGKLCIEKKNELQINEEDYTTDKKRIKKTIKTLSDKLTEYRKWLLQLTICDPACGSGAFLNQSLDFLISEHQYIDELQSKLFGDSMILSDIENSILENNLFGVDINEESVEITKLSLWLRTAQPNRKLNNLSSNIKCGNSLIDEPIEGVENYFKWETEFPKVFEKGGFDVIIGNPPYVRIQNLDYKIVDWLKENMNSAHKRLDISILFIEKGLTLINDNGIVSYITSNQFFKAEYGRKIREIIKGKLIRNLDLSKISVFEGLSTYVSILDFSKKNTDKFEYSEIVNTPELSNINWFNFYFSNFSDESWEFGLNNVLKDKIFNQSVLIEELVSFIYGIITGNDGSFILTESELKENKIEKDVVLPFLKPENYKKYNIKEITKYIIYPYDDNNKVIEEEIFKIKFPNAYSYLFKNKVILENRQDSRTTIKEKGIEWYSIMRRVSLKELKKEKIIFFDVGNSPNFILDNNSLSFGGGTSHSMYLKNESKVHLNFILGVINSKLLSWIIRDICPIKMGDARKYGLSYIKRLPIKISSQEIQNKFVDKVDYLISENQKINNIQSKFQRVLQRKFEIEKLTKKLQEWYLLSYGEFLKELTKQKLKLSISEETEWEDFFTQESKKVLELKSSIVRTDKEIDMMVYELYGLTDEEIKIIESSN